MSLRHDQAFMLREDRACKTHPALAGMTTAERVAVFYPERGASMVLPRTICADCPVNKECGDWGIAHELYGVFGGMSSRQRIKIRHLINVTMVSPSAIAEV